MEGQGGRAAFKAWWLSTLQLAIGFLWFVRHSPQVVALSKGNFADHHISVSWSGDSFFSSSKVMRSLLNHPIQQATDICQALNEGSAIFSLRPSGCCDSITHVMAKHVFSQEHMARIGKKGGVATKKKHGLKYYAELSRKRKHRRGGRKYWKVNQPPQDSTSAPVS